jgi:hypothetical protein
MQQERGHHRMLCGSALSPVKFVDFLFDFF